jgi:predicted lipoprotein with Yx(FWY)xxD motif
MHTSPWSRVAVGAAFLCVTAMVGSLWLSVGTRPTAAQGTPTIQTRQTGLGTVLTGPNGMTLYTFDRDTPGVSNCNGNCAAAWPPLPASGTPTAPAGVGGTLTVITRADGSQQVAYNAQPLYFYAEDQQPGQTTGDGVGGVWHVAKPVGAAQTMPRTGVGVVADTPLGGRALLLGAGLVLGTLGLLTLRRRGHTA